MKYFKRIISCVCIFAIILSFSDSAFAEEFDSTSGSLWDMYWANAAATDNWLHLGIAGKALASIHAGMSGNACSKSSDGWHHSDSYISKGQDNRGKFYLCSCSECNSQYKVYTDEFSSGYAQHVSEMPVNGVSSDGGLLWYPTVSDPSVVQSLFISYSGALGFSSFPVVTDYGHFHLTATGNGTSEKINMIPAGSYSDLGLSSTFGIKFSFKFYVPVSGAYYILSSPYCSASFLSKKGTSYSTRADYTSGSSGHYDASKNQSISMVPTTKQISCDSSIYSIDADVYLPVFSVVPDNSALVGHENDFDLDTRPGDIIQIDNVTIVDETNNYYTDPGSGEQKIIESWSYDYSDRSYHVTTNEGDNITVTYGDEHVTIQQGDTINEYNYYITQTSDPDPDPTPVDPDPTPVDPDPKPVDPEHTHSYTSTATKAATCTEAGSITYTCSSCGHTYTESVPALGHDWIVSESTEDQFSFPLGVTCPDGADHGLTYTLDRDAKKYHVTCTDCGKVFDVDADVTYGHKVYTCSRCGETYEESNKDNSGLFEAIGDFLAHGVRWAVDKLKQLVEAFQGIGEIFTGFAERLEESAGGYPEFFAQILAIMPEDLMNVIWFAIVAAFGVAAWRKWFG